MHSVFCSWRLPVCCPAVSLSALRCWECCCCCFGHFLFFRFSVFKISMPGEHSCDPPMHYRVHLLPRDRFPRLVHQSTKNGSILSRRQVPSPLVPPRSPETLDASCCRFLASAAYCPDHRPPHRATARLLNRRFLFETVCSETLPRRGSAGVFDGWWAART